MKFFSLLRLRNRSNPNPLNLPSYPNLVQNHPIPNETDGGSYESSWEVLPLLDGEDDYRTAATSSDWRIGDDDDDDDDNEISSSGGKYLEEVEDASSSSSSERRRRIENDENSLALMNGTTYTSSVAATTSLVVSEGKKNTDTPPTDDCCPICFGAFVIPCRAPCGHWYCGGCILQYWNYSVALQPCNCPMCSRKITNLAPEASLFLQQEVEVTEVLKNVRKYNRLFMGGTYGFILKLLELPLYVRRMFQDMMNPDRPGAHINKLRILAMLMGLLYTLSPFDFLHIGRRNIIDVFDYSAMALSFILYLVGIYIRRRRFQRVREIAAIQL